MSRYSKVSRRMWGDEGFRELSAPPPNAQTLWFRLLTGPELTNIPGLFPVWEAGLAQALRWPLEGFREAFKEVADQGMAEADWEAGLVWVPKAIEHNRPENPNVVKSWRETWSELPECRLKTKAYHSIRSFLKGFSKAFLEAFDEGCAKPSSNQEQEQEQEQEGDRPSAGAVSPTSEARIAARADRAFPNRVDDGCDGFAVDAYEQALKRTTGRPVTRLAGGGLGYFLRALDAHGPAVSDLPIGTAVDARIAWASELGTAFGASGETTKSPPKLADWLDRGRRTAKEAATDDARYASAPRREGAYGKPTPERKEASVAPAEAAEAVAKLDAIVAKAMPRSISDVTADVIAKTVGSR